MNKRGVNCSSFVFLFAIGMGVIWLVITVQGMQAARESETWHSTNGVIEETWVERDERTDADGEIEDYYKPYLKYSYLVNNRTYSSQRVDFGPQRSYGRASGANKFLAQYLVGSQVEVFYDPAEPGQAVLVREASSATWGLIGGGAMVIFPIVAWIGVRLKGKRAAEAEPEAVSFPE
jgi:hypothetical protein